MLALDLRGADGEQCLGEREHGGEHDRLCRQIARANFTSVGITLLFAVAIAAVGPSVARGRRA